MHRVLCAVTAIALGSVASVPAASQTLSPSKPAARPGAAALPQEKPYPPVAIAMTAAPMDASFAAFRAQLAAAAKTRRYAELTGLVAAQGFFWEGDRSGGFDPRRTALENLAAAIGLERGAGGGWVTLASIAGLADAAPMASRPGVVCAPALPEYDVAEFERLVAATDVPVVQWAYPSTPETAVRAAPRANGAVVEALAPSLVRVLDRDPSLPDARTEWLRVATPSGRTGFVAPGFLMPLRSERLCYSKDATGRWRIAGYIAAGE